MAEQQDRQRDDSSGAGGDELVWFLVERSDQHAAIEQVAQRLGRRGVETEVVTITEVIGSAAREAVAGGAERILRGLRVAWQGGGEGEEDFLSAIRRARPDLLVVTSGRHARPLSLLESITGAASVQVGVPLDFNVSTAWLNGSIEAFIAPDERSIERLADAGYSDDRLFRAGPPILPNVESEIDREAVRAEMGFGDRQVVLVRADSFDPTTLDRLVFQATLVEDDPQFVFHHNGDGAVAQALRRAADQHGLPAAMFGRVPDLERYLAAADAVVAASAEPYLPEIVRLGRPVFLVGPERDYARQIDVLTELYGARYVSDALRVGGELERFLEPERLAETLELIDEGRLEPSNDAIVEALEEALGRVETWKSERPATPGVGPEPAPETGSDDGDQLPVRRGPFETIGSGGGETEEAEGTGGASGGRRRPSLSRAEAKEQLAELILIERDLERRLSELEREQERWRNRLDLAREWGEEDLADEAKGILREYIDDAAEAREELEDILRQKEKLKQAARRGQGGGSAPGRSETERASEEGRRASELEDRFSEMELDRELDDLRDRIEGELGD